MHLNDLAEAMKALDGKKWRSVFAMWMGASSPQSSIAAASVGKGRISTHSPNLRNVRVVTHRAKAER